MNFNSRLKKVERQTKGFSESCECKNTPKIETIYYEDGKPATTPGLTQELREPVPDVCAGCGKPVNKTTIIVDFVSSNIPKPEDAT